MKIAIYGRSYEDNFSPSIQELFDELAKNKAQITIHKTFYEYLKSRVRIDADITLFTSHEEIEENTEYLISIGGDGTLLDSTTLVRDSGIPILGINTGRLGFLTGISTDEIKTAISTLVSKDYVIDERALMKLESPTGLFGKDNFALNEMTIHKSDSSSMIMINVSMDGEFLNSYWADGLIIATPTGSTAYSLSCGGPIVMPGSDNLVITPVAPHNLNVRPIVIPDNKTLTLKVEGRSHYYLVGLDSRSETIDSSIELTVSKNDFCIGLLRLKQHKYLSTIRNKLNWGLDKRN